MARGVQAPLLALALALALLATAAVLAVAAAATRTAAASKPVTVVRATANRREPVELELALQESALVVFGGDGECWNARETYFLGNYSVVWTAASNESVAYTVRFGEQRCSTVASDATAFDFAKRDYTDANLWTHRWGYYPFYPSYYPKVELFCATYEGCAFTFDVWMNVYRREMPGG